MSRHNNKLLALYGLKFNPFAPSVPTEALYLTEAFDQFCWRVEHTLLREGGFALVSGEPGSGKSAVLRLLAERLEAINELTLAVLTHPQSNLADFYRERQAMCSPWLYGPIIAGAASRSCANAGRHTCKMPACARSC